MKTCDTAIALLRSTFETTKPPHRVYRELFAKEQSASVKTDIFICTCHTILAQLTANTLSEETQINMVYGVLHPNIRKDIPRDKINAFSDLLT